MDCLTLQHATSRQWPRWNDLLSRPSNHVDSVVSQIQGLHNFPTNNDKCRLRACIKMGILPEGDIEWGFQEPAYIVTSCFTLSKTLFLNTAYHPTFWVMHSQGQGTPNARMLENSFIRVGGRPFSLNLSIGIVTGLGSRWETVQQFCVTWHCKP